jgi:predicted transcriptional regulator
MRDTLTVSLPKSVRTRLDKLVTKEHISRSEVVQEALLQYLARREFRKIRAQAIPEAEARGLFTDEDVFREIS